MRRWLTIFCCGRLAMTLVIRSTPRACGSIIACCPVEGVVAADPSCCKPSSSKPASQPTTHPAADVEMSCCTPLAAPVPPVASTTFLGNRAIAATPSAIVRFDTRTLEPATPPPRLVG